MTKLNDVKGILDKLVDWTKGQGEKQSKRSNPWGWVTGLLVSAVALFTAGFLAWRARKQGKELAKLKHEKDVAEQKKITSEASSKTIKNQVKAATLRADAVEAIEKIKELDKQIEEIEARRTKHEKQIDAVKNWDDVARLRTSEGS